MWSPAQQNTHAVLDDPGLWGQYASRRPRVGDPDRLLPGPPPPPSLTTVEPPKDTSRAPGWGWDVAAVVLRSWERSREPLRPRRPG